MKRFLAKTGRFFRSWGFLKFILWTVTLVVLFYVEEDWRGARVWASTKAAWEAKGESFDYEKFIPPPVPDDENLAAISLFKLETNPTKGPFQPESIPITLQRAFRGDLQHELPSAGTRQEGELPNWMKIRTGIADLYGEAFKGAKPPATTLAQLDAVYPFLAELRAASATRPLCRFPFDVQVPADPPIGLLTAQVGVSRILSMRILLELDDHQPSPALTDLKTGFKLTSGVSAVPSYYGGLIAISMNAIFSEALDDGLATRAWNDAQLAGVQDGLGQIDFLSVYQNDLRSEVAGQIVPFMDSVKKTRPPYFLEELRQGLGSVPLSIRPLSFWPDGWLEQNKCQRVAYTFAHLQAVDPKSRRIFPKIAEAIAQQKVQADARLDAWAPWNCFFTLANRDWSRMAQAYAQAQVRVDQTRVASGLERYRLAHGAYPASLDALVPAYIDELPHDIMNGEPYHYRLQADGTYLLYSVGWNQGDDGGKVVYKNDASGQIDYSKGDWVWPMPERRGP